MRRLLNQYKMLESNKVRILALTSIWLLWISPLNLRINVNGERTCNSFEIINNDLKKLSRYKNCEVIIGSVTLAKISSPNITDYQLSIREITGFLMIYRVEFLTSLENMFPNLTVIKGELKFLKNSVIIYENLNLLNLGLGNLVQITDGSIRISRNPQLCFVTTVNWLGILSNMSRQNFVFKDNRNENHCAACKSLDEDRELDASKQTYCWKTDLLQKASCRNNSGKAIQNIPQCCSDECLSSCTLDLGNSQSRCSVCAKLKDERGNCVSTCDDGLYKLRNRQCVSKNACKGLNMTILNGVCNKTCPEGYILGQNKLDCLKCPDKKPCPKLCTGNITIHTEDDLVALKGCTQIDGYLEIELKPKNTKIISLLESHLCDIEEISGYLKISKSPQITTLKFLKNLLTIGGELLYQNRYSLYIYDNFNLESLWESNQQLAFLNGSYFYHLNPKLCIDLISNLNFKNQINDGVVEGIFNISNGYETFCHKTTFVTSVEEVSETEARVKISPFLETGMKTNFLGYIYYYIESPEKNMSLFDSFHGCGHDNWHMGISLGLNIRYVIRNLKPSTQYAYFARTFIVMNYHFKLNSFSNINYFKTKNYHGGLKPIQNLFFNVLNTTAIKLFWWPLADDIGSGFEENLSHYIRINFTVIAQNWTENSIKSSNTSACLLESSNKWRGLNPKETDYYKREQFLVEDILPDFIFTSFNQEGKPQDEQSQEAPDDFPESETLDRPRLDKFMAYINATKRKFALEQDTGTDDFQLNHATNKSLSQVGENCCGKTCICRNGSETSYVINNLEPGTRYKIKVKVCNKSNICSTSSYLYAKTMQKKRKV